MNYETPLLEGRLLRRYKRFFCDIELPDGTTVIAHCPNTGSMRTCLAPLAPCRISKSDNPRRKLGYTLEQVCIEGQWIMVHTGRTNDIVAEAIQKGDIPELTGFAHLERERPFPSTKSRVDILLSNEPSDVAFVEVKNVTLLEDGKMRFPDSVTTRGQKHLRELMSVLKPGVRSVLFFHVGRGGARHVEAAQNIDPTYADLLQQAAAAGVEVLAYESKITEKAVILTRRLPVLYS